MRPVGMLNILYIIYLSKRNKNIKYTLLNFPNCVYSLYSNSKI